jgi:glutaredoxin-like protein NrdH
MALDKSTRPHALPTESSSLKTRTITIYTQPNCQPCKATKRWLDKRTIPYQDIDVTTSPEDAEAIRALGFKEAPVVIVSTGDPETDLMWSGFIPDNLTKYAHSTEAA